MCPRGAAWHRGSILASHPAALGLNPSNPENFQRLINWLEESGQLLENVDQTHLFLASGKPVLQKRSCERLKTNSRWNTECRNRFKANKLTSWCKNFWCRDQLWNRLLLIRWRIRRINWFCNRLIRIKCRCRHLDNFLLEPPFLILRLCYSQNKPGLGLEGPGRK